MRQSFSDIPDELGIREDAEAQGFEEILADRLRAAMHEQGPTNPTIAARIEPARP